jgi:hypothetical protein
LDEDDEEVAAGYCGARDEITRVYDNPPPPGVPGNPFTPFVPDAGFVIRQVGKITALTFIIGFGAWQLTNKNSWLLRKR